MVDQQTPQQELQAPEDVNEGKTKEAVSKNEQLGNNGEVIGSALPARVIIVNDPQRQWPFTMKDVLNFLVQLLNIVAVLVFGVWAIRSYDSAVQAVSLAEAANALTIFQICQSNVDELASKVDALQKCYPILNSYSLAQPLQNVLSSNIGVYATQTSSSSVSVSTLTKILTSTVPASNLSSSRTKISQTLVQSTLFATTQSSTSIQTTPNSKLTTLTTSTPTGILPGGTGQTQSSGLSLGIEIGLIVGIVVGLPLVITAAWLAVRVLQQRRLSKTRAQVGMISGTPSQYPPDGINSNNCI